MGDYNDDTFNTVLLSYKAGEKEITWFFGVCYVYVGIHFFCCSAFQYFSTFMPLCFQLYYIFIAAVVIVRGNVWIYMYMQIVIDQYINAYISIGLINSKWFIWGKCIASSIINLNVAITTIYQWTSNRTVSLINAL